MQNFKIGKNAIHIVWAINDINGNPRDLSRLIPSVFYACGGGRVEAQYVEVKGNIISWTFPAREQKIAGTYALSLVLKNLDGTEYSRLYRAEAFTLTPLRANDTIMAVQTESEQNVYLTACMTLADTSNKADLFYVDNRLEQVETNAREYADAAVAGHVVIFDGTNSFAEITDAIHGDIPIIARFPGGTNIGGITIDSDQMAVATTKTYDGDVIQLRFVFCEEYSWFQAEYEARDLNETSWTVTSDYLATRDDLASKPDIFILSEDSSLEEAINAINQKMFIAIWSNHPDSSGGYLFADYVDILSDGLPFFCFHYIKNFTVNEVVYQYINTDEYNVGWAISDSEYTIPLSGNLVTLNSEQTITAAKTFSAGINMNRTRIRKLATPVNNDDAANKSYVDDSLQTAVNAKADVVEISNYVTEGAVLPYPGVYQYGSNFPHVASFRRSEEGADVWYLAFCLTHLPPNSPIGYYYIFYRQDPTDYKFKFVKMVNWSDNFNDEWYKLGAKVFGEDLQETKQDKLTDEQIANIAAVPNKVDLVEISYINADSSAGTRFPFPAIYSYYGGTLPHAAQFSQHGIDYVVLCIWHDASGTPADRNYALFKRIETNPAYIEFLRYVAEGDEFFTICQQQFHDDLPAKVTTLQSAVTSLQSEVAALKAIINEITIKEE